MRVHPVIPLSALAWLTAGLGPVAGQSTGYHQNLPRVVVPTHNRPVVPARPAVQQAPRTLYPWKTHITATIFWIGEQPTANNPTPNCKSSWDTRWAINYGGYDNPDPAQRIACHTTGDFRPRAFIPRLNPFYIALPYNDVMRGARHKPEASRVIPWFARFDPAPGRTVLKGRWLQIFYNGRSCYAQWEDCGPWVTNDWEYVFGDKRPRATQNNSAGIDLSPAVRDYLGMQSHQKVHWRFVEDNQVPHGPWKLYGQQAPVVAGPIMQAPGAPIRPVPRPPDNADIETQRAYLEYLRQLRDENFAKRPLR